MTNISPSLDRQAWTITISNENKLLAYFNFEWDAIIVILFQLQNILCMNRIKISRKSCPMHKCHMSHFVLPVFFSPSAQESRAGCAKASLFLFRESAFPLKPTLLSLHAAVYWSKQNDSQDGHTEVSCDWLRWYSTESKSPSKITILKCFVLCFAVCFFFFCLNMMHCTSTVQTPPPPSPPHLLRSRCGPLHPQVGSQGCVEQKGVENLFLSLQWERENETEREHKSIHHGSFHPSLCAQTQAAAMLIGKREERGGVGSTDQGSAAISLCIDQWPGAVSGSSPSSPLHLPWCPPPTHFSPYQSSRTCRQRCPPLALHCQRMMQQRHRRWPPPCTEGGGVTGAK